jgi:Arc/MetJ-type ribon-helix-helix transcriptional regulator
MPEWATISIREELIEEIRNLLKRTGRYRSISEFVAESIRLRLEELSARNEAVAQAPLKIQPASSAQLIPVSTVTQPVVESTRTYINAALQRSEQIWWVLVRLFGDMTRKGVNVSPEYARDLRNCRTLINLVRINACPDCDIELANKRLPDLRHDLEQVKRDLVTSALYVSEEYARDWIDEIDRAERGELREGPSTGPTFIPGLPKENGTGWTRVTLPRPIEREKAEEISKQLGVSVEQENSVHLVVHGEKEAVRKAVEMLYQTRSR